MLVVTNLSTADPCHQCYVLVISTKLSGRMSPPTEFVFMNRVGMNRDFFYIYNYLLCDLHVRVLFYDFTLCVLCILNVAPMQLHLNKWTTMQAFRALCLYSSMSVTHELFLHYFCSHPQDKAQWISLIWMPKCPLFRPFTSLYNNFKTSYFKVTMRLVIGNPFFYNFYKG